MQVGAITGYIDVAQVTLYVFWVFFAGLIFYLRREDRREGYPLVDEGPLQTRPVNAVPVDSFEGSALTPLGNPLLAGVGPGAWGMRADEPDLTYEDQIPKIVPLRVATGYYLDTDGPDPRGYTVIAGDDMAAGEVVDIWVDRNELLVRFFEVEPLAAGGPRRVLVEAEAHRHRGGRGAGARVRLVSRRDGQGVGEAAVRTRRLRGDGRGTAQSHGQRRSRPG